MSRLSPLLLFVAACGSPGPVGPVGPAEPSFLDVGTTWVYSDDKGTDFTTRIEAVAIVDGVSCVKVRGASVGISYMRWKSADVAYWSRNANAEVLLHGVGEDDGKLYAREPVKAFRKDADRGMSWEGRFYDVDSSGQQTAAASCKFICGGLQTVGTAYGDVEAYYVVEEWRFQGEVQIVVENWWTERQGLVRHTWRRVNGEDATDKMGLMLKTMLNVRNIPRKP